MKKYNKKKRRNKLFTKRALYDMGDNYILWLLIMAGVTTSILCITSFIAEGYIDLGVTIVRLTVIFATFLIPLIYFYISRKEIASNALKEKIALRRYRLSKISLTKLINNNGIEFEIFNNEKLFTAKASELLTYHIKQSKKVYGGADCSILYKSSSNHFFTYSFTFHKGDITRRNIVENSEKNIRELFSNDKVMYELAFDSIVSY